MTTEEKPGSENKTSSEAGQQPPAKKKERAAQPPPPAAVSTAYVLVRYAMGSLLTGTTTSASSDSDDPFFLELAPFQATYLKDQPRLTGKMGFSISRAAASQTMLVDDKAQGLQPGVGEEEFWNALQSILHRIVAAAAPPVTLSYCNVTKQTLLETYGEAMASLALLDESHVGKKSKLKPNDPLVLVLLQEQQQQESPVVFATVAPGIPYATTTESPLESITLDREQCDIKSGKKGLQISVKWQVNVKQQNEKDDAAAATTTTTLATLCESVPPQIPVIGSAPEGQALVQKVMEQQQQQQEETNVEQPQQSISAAKEAPAPQEMKVDPFNVEGTIDYDKLVQQFGSTLLDKDLLQRLEALVQQRKTSSSTIPTLHRFLRRDLFFSHRDLNIVVTQLEQGTAPLYLYTGRGPSSSAMHLGHLVPFLFTQWLQQALNVPLVIQMTDDEKFLFKGEYDESTGDNLEYFQQLTMENARDIIACGFDYDKTFIFSDLDYVGRMYPNICRIWKAVTTNTVNHMFGFDGSSNMGKIAFPAIQAAPSFASSFPTVLQVPPEERRKTNQMCLIPCAIDQDPYFRMTRDVAHKLVDKTQHPLQGKPALIHSKFFPPLQGAEGKMSSSNANSAIFLTDTADEIATKIKSFCFSGGQETKAAQEKYGANLEIDVAYQWLRFFLEDDDELAQIGQDYSTGSGQYWSTGKVKDRLISVLQRLVAEHQQRRAQITDEEVRKWMTERCILTNSK